MTPYQFRFGRKPRVRVRWRRDGSATYTFAGTTAQRWPDGSWSLVVRGWLHPAVAPADIERAFYVEFSLAAGGL